MDDETREDLTPDEAAQMDETGETPAEAHRAGEFDDLAAKLDALTSMVGELGGTLGQVLDAVQAQAAVAVDNGAEYRDVDGDGDLDIVTEEQPVIPEVEDMDLDI